MTGSPSRDQNAAAAIAGRRFGVSRAVASEGMADRIYLVATTPDRVEGSLAIRAWQDYRKRLPVPLE